ncbi:hypothetical protein V7128_01160 [Neobacillus vireti]|uniref:hypothetical protein n=1 Tax=Neobacillus vireti TaxID=220686 RepID=UPI002FFEBC8A
MTKLNFSSEEVASFLEMKLLDNTATYEQEQLYVDYKWNGKFERNYTLRKTLNEMKKWS